MAMRPLDRLPSVRAKLGSVIVFAVAVTIVIMYVAIGFALRKSDRDREFRAAVAEAKGLQTLAFGQTGTPIQPARLQRLLVNAPNRVIVIDASDRRVIGDQRLIPLQSTSVPRLLSGQSSFDTGKTRFFDRIILEAQPKEPEIVTPAPATVPSTQPATGPTTRP